MSHHRLIHHNKKSGELLPQPTLEEEVVATPFDLLSKGDHPGGGRGGRGGRGFESSQSHLRFEISSDDGFSCQGDSMEGKSLQFFSFLYHHLLEVLWNWQIIPHGSSSEHFVGSSKSSTCFTFILSILCFKNFHQKME